MSDKFVIRLIRDTKDTENDDVIRITPTSNGKYQVELDTAGHQLVNTQQKKTHLKGMSFDAVKNYVKTLLFLLPIDDDGYHFVQVDMPCMPAILLTTDKLHCDCLTETIMDYMNSIESVWSEEEEKQKPRVIPPPLPAGARRHIFFDEEGGISHIKTSFYE
jgi:hypothetical protein